VNAGGCGVPVALTPREREAGWSRVWRFGDGVTTDDMLPGKYAPFMVGEERFHAYAFAHMRPEFASTVGPGDVIAAGRNWGLGSSREYAPDALKRLGVGLVVASSFARIHYRNLLNLGLSALVSEEVALSLEDGEAVRYDRRSGTLERRSGPTLTLPLEGAFLRDVRSAGTALAYYRLHRRFPGGTPDA
jgi:methanogen homoaconitase small subunit